MTNEEGGIDPEEARYESARRSRQHDGDRLARHDARLRAVPQPQVRSVHAEGLLPDAGVLPQQRLRRRRRSATARATSKPRSTCRRPSRRRSARRSRPRSTSCNATLKAETPALARAQAAWEQEMRSSASAAWTSLTPAHLAADGGVDSHGRSPTARSSRPARTPARRSTRHRRQRRSSHASPRSASRRLPDPLAAEGRPRPRSYGNFQLTGIEIEAGQHAPRRSSRSERTKRSAATSVDAFFPKTLPRDVTAPRGWRIDASRDEKRLPRQIVFTLDQPLDSSAAG